MDPHYELEVRAARSHVSSWDDGMVLVPVPEDPPERSEELRVDVDPVRALLASADGRGLRAWAEDWMGRAHEAGDIGSIRFVRHLEQEGHRYLRRSDRIEGAPGLLWEHVENAPQALFTITTEGGEFVGRKHLSARWVAGKIDELFCSRIEATMLLGRRPRWRVGQDHVWIAFDPLTAAQAVEVHASVARDPMSEITFPFPGFESRSRSEIRSKPSGWDLTPEAESNLAHGETAFVEATLRWLQESPPRTGAVYFDPACSTGVFLASLKASYPRIVSVGQDLSAEMVTHASLRLDRVVVGNAAQPCCADDSVDVLFVRFLNAEVVTTRFAHALFARLARTLRPGGTAVVFGHTPVLLSGWFFDQLGLARIQSSAATIDGAAVFQFYRLERRGPLRPLTGIS